MSRRGRAHKKRLVGWGLAYLVVVLCAFGLLRLSREQAVPVFGPASPAPHPVRRWMPFSGWRQLLEAGFPYLVYSRSPSQAAADWPGQALRLVAGIRMGDAKSVLDAEIPVLASARLDLYLPGPDPDSAIPTVIVGLPPGIAGGETLVAFRPKTVQVGIYHTHARESFLPELGPRYRHPEDAHTDDVDISVVRLGREIASVLQTEYGIGTVHSLEIHDLAGRVGAYIRSELTASRILREYPTVQLLLDVHRDSQTRAHTTAMVDGVSMARVMVVLGTEHPNWRNNYEVAKDFLGRLEVLYPGLTIGIYPKPGRYNQQLSAGALLLEVGGVENTMEECLRTAAAIAKVVAQMVGWKGEP
ncbi:MAG: stage II sporulation protein P [Bacillota bacterium]